MQIPYRVTGLITAALGGVAFYGGSLFPPVPGHDVGPNVFPMVIGSGLMLCGALIAFGVGRQFEEEAEAELAGHENPPEPAPAEYGRFYGLHALVPPVLLIFYVMAVEDLGFIATSAIMVAITARLLGASWRLTSMVTILAPVFIHFAFCKILRVPLPAGLIPMPW